MPNYPKPYVKIPPFNIIRPIATVADPEQQLDAYDTFFEQNNLHDYRTDNPRVSGLTLLGNKHLLYATRHSTRFQRIPAELLLGVLTETADETTQEPLNLAVEKLDWIPRGNNQLIFAAIVDPKPVVSEHEKFVDTLGNLAGLDIWPSENSNHIPLAYCSRRLPPSLIKEFLDITPHTYDLNPATFIQT